MKRGIELKKIHKKGNKKNYFITFVFIIFLFIFFFAVYYFSSYKKCSNEICFREALKKCEKIEWMRVGEKSDWLYKITDDKEEFCEVKVKLLKIKEGKIDLEILEGKEMICEVLKNESFYPEENISKCTGRLKEDIQNILIRRMHDYLLKNIEEIKEEFKKV